MIPAEVPFGIHPSGFCWIFYCVSSISSPGMDLLKVHSENPTGVLSGNLRGVPSAGHSGVACGNRQEVPFGNFLEFFFHNASRVSFGHALQVPSGNSPAPPGTYFLKYLLNLSFLWESFRSLI